MFVKVKIVQQDANLTKEKNEVINHFIKFLYDRMPIESVSEVHFIGKPKGDMTTGSYTMGENVIKVLTKKRMLIDVLRTLAHEWIHGAQHEILGWGKGPDIGGRNEDGCNIYAGMLMKEYQNEHPLNKSTLYEGKSSVLIESREQILSEIWSVKKTNELLKPNEKTSKKDLDKGLYRRMIEKVLNDNESKLNDKGVSNVRGHWFYSGTENGHPLSYLNTHYGVAVYLMNLFNVPTTATKEEAIKIVEDGLRNNIEDLLFPDGETPENNLIMGLLAKSKSTGGENEKKAKAYLEKKYGDIIQDINIVAETGGELDKAGVDIVVRTTNGKTINYQVKPFKFYRIADDGNAVIYGVAGRTPVNSRQDRWIFVTGNKTLEVSSKNLKEGIYKRDVMYLPASDIISKSSNLLPWVPKDKEI